MRSKKNKSFLAAAAALAGILTMVLFSACPSDDSSDKPKPKISEYTIKLIQPDTATGCTIEASKTKAKANDTITLTAKPAEGYIFLGFDVTQDGGGKIDTQNIPVDPNRKLFQMPAGNVTVTANFQSDTHEYLINKIDSSGGAFTIDKTKSVVGGTITINSSPAGGNKVGAVIVTMTDEPFTAVSVTEVEVNAKYTFLMPAHDVNVTVDFWPLNRVYSIYSGGAKPGANVIRWNGALTTDAEHGRSGGHAIHYTASETYEGWCGFSIEFDPGINFNNVDALSFWAHSPDSAVIQTGFGGDNQNTAKWEIAYKGNDDMGLEITSRGWQQVIIPIPKRVSKSDLKQAIYVLGDGLLGKTIVIDDVEFISAARTFDSITIPSEVALVSTQTMPIQALIGGAYHLSYTVDSTPVSLFFHDSQTVTNWFGAPSFTVGGNATRSGNNIIAGDVGSFTVTVTIDGKTSNTMNGTIHGVPSSKIIDDFSDIPAGGAGGNWGEGAGLVVLEQLGFSFTLPQWWAGAYHDLPGGNVASKVGVQCGSEWGPVDIARTNQHKFDFMNDITPFKTTYPIVSFHVYVRAPASNVGSDPITFELRTGQHLATASQHTAWAAPEFFVNRTRPNTNPTSGAGDNEMADWYNVRIPLENFRNASNASITSLEKIILTGWRIAATRGNCTVFISDIKLIAGLADVIVNVEAEFEGFPENLIVISKAATPMKITLDQYDTATWYVNGRVVQAETDGTFILNVAGLETGANFLSVVVTLNGHKYSKSIEFTVTD